MLSQFFTPITQSYGICDTTKSISFIIFLKTIENLLSAMPMP
ncbi:hypothetical protein HMPREF0971_00241 [Segatella oris F0302]|uniref:Uncharacterized protein n=1 Tax=Segatella oris F0302 TaxID=649760 RepID=D1QMV2_9BACT|nr:hypothetical protein HMPREF0971_00241 [Segatella oris F0302]